MQKNVIEIKQQYRVLLNLICRSLASIALLTSFHTANADTFDTLVGYNCDQKTDSLIVTYRGAYNDEGASLVLQKKPTEWSPGNLIASMKDDNHIGKLRTIKATCKLRHSVYHLRIGPTPGNFNIMGSCGASISAWVEVRRGKKIVLPHYELEGNCHDTEAPITTEIAFSGSSAHPIFKKVLPAEFLK
jgi:hypothetical protein